MLKSTCENNRPITKKTRIGNTISQYVTYADIVTKYRRFTACRWLRAGAPRRRSKGAGAAAAVHAAAKARGAKERLEYVGGKSIATKRIAIATETGRKVIGT